MNTETGNNGGMQGGSGGGKLQGAFGDRGTNVNAIAYGHPYGEQIIEGVREVFSQCETGQAFLRIWDHHRLPIHIMKGMGESGFSTELKTIFLQVPGKTTTVNGEIIIAMAKSIREADQEYAGFKAPDPAKDVLKFAGFMHARNLDSTWYVCKMVKELTNSSFYSVLLDTLTNLGLNNLYEAFLDGVSKEELYDYYAEAYESRGSI